MAPRSGAAPADVDDIRTDDEEMLARITDAAEACFRRFNSLGTFSGPFTSTLEIPR